MICSEPDCAGTTVARGLCPKHYRRLLRHGSAQATLPSRRASIIAPGTELGRLTVIAEVGRSQEGLRLYQCRCICGTSIVVTSRSLNSGNTRSCGCSRKLINVAHGHTRGGKSSATYSSWQAMWRRCIDPANKAYEGYGGRGIGVCERWRRFEAFLSDLGERPAGKTLDRINVEGNYEPANCRWATATEQARNRRPRRSR